MEEVKEEFCGACIAGITALAGAGTAVGSTKVNKKVKKTVFWIGVVVSIISILILIYFLFINCKDCA